MPPRKMEHQTTTMHHAINAKCEKWFANTSLRVWTLAGSGHALHSGRSRGHRVASLSLSCRGEFRLSIDYFKTHGDSEITDGLLRAAYDRLGLSVDTLRDRASAKVNIDPQGVCHLCISVDAVDPTHAQTLACTLAEILGENKAQGLAGAKNRSKMLVAHQAFLAADEKYRQSLARLGERESKSTDPWVEPVKGSENGSSEIAPR